MRKITLSIITLVFAVPLTTFAAFNDVTLTTSTIIQVSGNNFTVSGASTLLQSIAVNTGSFNITVAAGSSLEITSSNQSDYTVTSDPAISSSVSCPSANSVLSITASGTTTVTVTPGGTCTIPGTGGGGGGSSSPPPPPPAPPPAPPAATTTATTSPVTVATTTVVIVNGPSLTKMLALGSTDPEVIALQQFLIAQGLLSIPPTTPLGYFGAATEAALKKFQQNAGLDPVGMTGPLTRTAIATTKITKYVTSGVPSGFVFTRSLKIGSSGADVAALQQILIAKGFLIFNAKSTPGYFGGLTKTAVVNFQKSLGLSPVGSVGPMTRTALNAITR